MNLREHSFYNDGKNIVLHAVESRTGELWVTAEDILKFLEYPNTFLSVLENVALDNFTCLANITLQNLPKYLDPYSLLLNKAGILELVYKSNVYNKSDIEKWINYIVFPCIQFEGY